MIYRMNVIPRDGDGFQTAEMQLSTCARLAHFFAYAGSSVTIFKSWDGDNWRRVRFNFSADISAALSSHIRGGT